MLTPINTKKVRLYLNELKAPVQPQLSYLAFMATEGGTKCPWCGRYAKSAELGWIGTNSGDFHLDAYGHLPGFGCNKPK